jgi:hypothetical protein
MNIDHFNKHELLTHMKGNGTIHRQDRDTYEWKHAFKLAKRAGFENWDMDCSKCWAKVKEWLMK